MNHPSRKQRKADLDAFHKILNSLGYKNYQEYLKSSLWSSIREKIFRRDNYTCQRCHSKSKQAHHLSYTEEVMKGEDLSQIISLCIPCHDHVEFLKTDKGKRSVEIDGEDSVTFQEKFKKWKIEREKKTIKKEKVNKTIEDIPKEDRQCVRCKKEKPVESFILLSTGKVQIRCLECRRERSENWRNKKKRRKELRLIQVQKKKERSRIKSQEFLERKKKREEFQSVLNRMGFSNYDAYLQSPLWIEIREKVQERDNYICKRCEDPCQVVHHWDYGEEVMKGNDLSKLVSLCFECHDWVEFLKSNSGKCYKFFHDIIGPRKRRFEAWKQKRDKKETRNAYRINLLKMGDE